MCMDREQEAYAQVSEQISAFKDLERPLHQVRCAQLVLESLLQGHIDDSDRTGTTGGQRWWQISLDEDEINSLVYALHNVGDEIAALREAFKAASEVGAPPVEETGSEAA